MSCTMASLKGIRREIAALAAEGLTTVVDAPDSTIDELAEAYDNALRAAAGAALA